MGEPRRTSLPRKKTDNPLSGDWGYAGSYDDDPRRMDARVCGRKRERELPKVGSEVGRLTITGFEIGPRGGILGVQIVCRCGHEGSVNISNLRSGRTTQCNYCAKKSTAIWIRANEGYGDVMPDDTLRNMWSCRHAAMLSRCHDSGNKAFKYYGGRGIRVCKRWHNRRSFLTDIQKIKNWNQPSLEIDRINNDGDYRTGSIRMATRSEQCKNKRYLGRIRSPKRRSAS